MCITPSIPKYNSNSIQPLSQLLETRYMNPFSPFSSIQKQGHYTSYRTHILLYYGCPRKFGLPLLLPYLSILILSLFLTLHLVLYIVCVQTIIRNSLMFYLLSMRLLPSHVFVHFEFYLSQFYHISIFTFSFWLHSFC